MTFSWFKSERFWRFAVGSIFFLGFLGGVFVGSLLIYPPAPGSFKFQQQQCKTALHDEPKYDAVGGGALALNANRASRFLPLIVQELTLLGANTRPGSSDERNLRLALGEEKNERFVTQGQPFFLQVEEPEGGQLKIVGFSSEEKGVKVTPLSLSDGKVRFEVGVFGEEGEERGEVVLEEKMGALAKLSYFAELKEAKWWGVDAFINQYGGSEQQEKKERQKIEFVGKEGYFCYVGMGDYLIWDGERWTECAQKDLSQQKPLARINSILGHALEIKVWDETGFLSEKIILSPHPSTKKPLNLDSLPSSIRMRSDREVTCLLGKRRLLLKEGDWILRTPQGWRPIKKAADIDDYLRHRLKGELFVFDKLEKEGGKIILHGHTFDEMRTQMQKVAIPVSTEKRQPKAKPASRIKRKLPQKQEA